MVGVKTYTIRGLIKVKARKRRTHIAKADTQPKCAQATRMKGTERFEVVFLTEETGLKDV